MPTWMIIIIGCAALVTALGVLWSKVLRPAATLITEAERAIPVLRDVTATFSGDSNVFKVIREIAAQFRTDSGSSLRDVVNRLEEAAAASKVTDEQLRASTEALRVSAESTKELAREDRAHVAELLTLLQTLNGKVDVNSSRVLDAASEAGIVADDLEASHKRAELHADDAVPGLAADAAARRPTPKEEK